MESMEINRRDFVKGTLTAGAATAACAALGTTAFADEATEEEVEEEVDEAAEEEVEEENDEEDTSSTVLTADNYQDVKWSFEVAPDPVDDSEITETYTHDIVIVGAGIAGLCTAVSAAEQGADVIVFSASSKPIGRGGSNHAIGSKYQQELGIEYDLDTAAREVVKQEQTAGSYYMDKKKWERWINNSAESMDWTIDIMEAKGLSVSLEPAYTDPDGILTVPAGSHNFWNEETTFGALYGAPLMAQAYADTFTDDYGGQIDYNTVAQYLIRDDDNTGRVSAVVAQKEDGSYVKYEANKAIVLATGDFSKNPDMMAKYSPWAYELFKDTLAGEASYDAELSFTGLMPGDGQKMGLWIGAAWQKTYPNAPMINGGATGPGHGVISNFWGLNMDIYGERYHNECTNFSYGAISLLQLPQQTAYAVWDVNYAYTQDQWEQFGCTINDVNGILALTPEELIASWDEEVESSSDSLGTASTVYYRADTLEELVAQMDGIDQEQALATIEQYNAYAEQGLDEQYHVNPDILYPISTPPFYATKTVGASFLTVCGGLRTNDRMQVCDEDDNPIEGLYNTGIMTGDFYANTYNFVMPGQNLGAVCGTLSYLLGRDLAEL